MLETVTRSRDENETEPLTGVSSVRTSQKEAGRIPSERVAAFKRRMGYYSKLNVLVYRLSLGHLMNTAMGGYPICIVSFTGAKTGRRRHIPLIHVPDARDILLIGSQAGLDRDPIWVRSLLAHPEVSITFSGKTQHYTARLLAPAEKRAAWPHLCRIYPDYETYQARTDRDIPVFRATLLR